MLNKTCPVCGSKSALSKENKITKAIYAGTSAEITVPVMVCSCCGAKFDAGKDTDKLRKQAMVTARNNSVSKTLEELEKTHSFVDIERSLYLPPKTLSKWKNQSKTPSAAAAALVSLLGVFPWLSYVGMANFEPVMAYKIAGAAFFAKATESEKIKAFFSASDNYEVLGLVSDKTVVSKGSDRILLDNKYTYGSQIISSEETF
ncbi:MAG: hypothetical protein J5527_11090 [Treponema sp.]|nr:hypothetical protein [Treponema sp.]